MNRLMTTERSTTSCDVRVQLVQSLGLDLVGPNNDHPFANELLPESPTRWYLTGFLVPTEAPIKDRFDQGSVEEIDAPAVPGGLDDDAEADRGAARQSLLPSSIGLSTLVPGGVQSLVASVEWGDYVRQGEDDHEAGETGEAERGSRSRGEGAPEKPGDEAHAQPRGWRRMPRSAEVTIDLPPSGGKPRRLDVPGSGGLAFVVTVRRADGAGLPVGTRAVSVFVVNYRRPSEPPSAAFAFQVRLSLDCAPGFVARPDLRGSDVEDDWDQRVADLQYREVCEYAVGHGVAAEAILTDRRCGRVRSTWVPTAEVERVVPSSIPGVELRMEALGALQSAEEARAALGSLIERYRAWLREQANGMTPLTGSRRQTVEDMLRDGEVAAARIEAGLASLADPLVFEAFRVANRAMARAGRQRAGVQRGIAPDAVEAPAWRPFQLAFILMGLRGIAQPTHDERELVDLLFFPTGGGKTEAYLGLAAFTLVHRRLVNPGIRSAGVSVLMRYTLRLLTLDQLGRAAALICALELEREASAGRLGSWPFEIGLWVGQAATPNRMGHRGYSGAGRDFTAYIKTQRYMRDSRSNPAPIPIEECPWCGTKFNQYSFRLVPNDVRPLDLRVHCVNHCCSFTGDRHLPIVAVDEPLYRRLPCFVIATVDKFAALPWTGEAGALFGRVARHDANGFYGPCATGTGVPLPDGRLLPPDLIIQDELHLISGPLGTIAGLYEAAVDALATREVGDRRVRPKIVASTATVRRAERQIRALFDRQRVRVFPPPGPDRRDSFFARTVPAEESPARLYIGLAAQGRSLKVLMLRSMLAVLSAAQAAWDRARGQANLANPADPYMTLVGYFNSLRELGGSRRIVEDEVRTRLAEYSRRRRREPPDELFVDRQISYEVLELTSRVSTDKVAEAKRRLALPFSHAERVDVALATNMISVGLDIVRLGLMVVLGQPKTSAEYIQATSRVGRDEHRPGLVVTLLNIHKPRDRSHFERFEAFHRSFYRSVEAASVTPYSPRALDRALAAALVAQSRQGRDELTAPNGAQAILRERQYLDAVARQIADRAAEHDSHLTPMERDTLRVSVLNRCRALLDDWHRIADRAREEGSGIQYQRETATPPRRLLREFLDPELSNLEPVYRRFRANRSMRDVEPSVEILINSLNDWGNQP
jgi:hypothetical protein